MDASFLTTETATAFNHVVGSLIVDPSSAADGFSVQVVKQLLTERLHLLPPFRRKLVEVPFSLAPPMWIEDRDFDLDNHVRRIGCPQPGTLHELAELVGDIAGRPLDRARPLWEMWYVEGLEEGRVALVTKMHHSAIDGVSGADLMVHLFDLTPEVTRPEPPAVPWQGEDRPSDWSMLTHALASAAQTPGNMARAAGNLVSAGRNLVSMARSDDKAAGMARPFSAPRTSFNGALTPHRAVAYAGAKLDDLKLIKNTFGTTINDVVLAASTGSLRDWLAGHGGIPDKPLVCAVPVSVRTEEQKGQLGNAVSTMLVELPTNLDDPVERLARIHETTKGAKEVHGALGADTIQQLAEAAPPALANLGARLYSSSKLADRAPVAMNLVISNIPGPPIPLYCAGGQVLATYPMGPLLEGSGLNFTVLSNMGNLDFGLICCPELVPHHWQLAEGFTEHVGILRKAAEAQTTAE